jgi:arsenite oxidase small subunit
VRLINALGEPIKSAEIRPHTNYVFFYPFTATPCLLLNLGKRLENTARLKTHAGQTYGWSGGVGPQHAFVAYSAICAHKLAYPAKEVSFIRFQIEKTKSSDAHMIHCCADHSVYDPAEGARVVSGPAPEPLAIILLEWDARTDALWAVGTLGAEQFDAFFKKYEFKLQLEYGAGARTPMTQSTKLVELTQYCRHVVQC